MNEPKLKILVLLTNAGLGGAERVALDYVLSAHARQAICHVVLPSQGAIEAVLASANIPTTVLNFGKHLGRIGQASRRQNLIKNFANLTVDLSLYLWRLRRLAISLNVDVIYTHGLKAEIFAAFISFLAPFQLVWHLHVFPPKGLAGRLHSLCARRTTQIIANSRAVLAALPKAVSKRTQVIYCGIDSDHWRPNNATLSLQTFSRRPNEISVGMISVLAPWKGVDLFLQAIAPIIHADARVRGMIVGDALYDTDAHQNHYKESLQGLAAHLGIAERVNFLPFLADPRPAFASLDIVVHASKTAEPFGRVIAEAMSCAKPVIASAGGGALEQIDHGIDGLLFPMNDVQALNQAITQLVSDPNLRQALGAAGRRRVKENLQIRLFQDGVQAVLRDAVSMR